MSLGVGLHNLPSREQQGSRGAFGTLRFVFVVSVLLTQYSRCINVFKLFLSQIMV